MTRRNSRSHTKARPAVLGETSYGTTCRSSRGQYCTYKLLRRWPTKQQPLLILAANQRMRSYRLGNKSYANGASSSLWLRPITTKRMRTPDLLTLGGFRAHRTAVCPSHTRCGTTRWTGQLSRFYRLPVVQRPALCRRLSFSAMDRTAISSNQRPDCRPAASCLWVIEIPELAKEDRPT